MTTRGVVWQGMVYVDLELLCVKLIRPFVEEKERIGLDFWACYDKSAEEGVYNPFIETTKKMVLAHLQRKKYLHIWSFEREVERVVRECLVSGYLGWEFAELFKGKTETELDEFTKSSLSENDVKREALNETSRLDAETGRWKMNVRK